MKYGSPLHVALHNEDFKNALKILKRMKKTDTYHPCKDLNRIDEDGNTPLHLVMKSFNFDVGISIKIASDIIRAGASLEF